MKCYFSSMKQRFMKSMVAAALAIVSLFNSTAQADEAAERVLGGARYASTLQYQNLHGTMRKDGEKTPISLFMRGENIQFLYKTSKGDKRFHMRLKKDQFDLLDIVNGKTTKFREKKIAECINGTDLSYEDLSMRFLYWKDSELVGEDKISGQKCHKVRLINPDKSGDYRIVYAWVHQKYGSLMRVVGYNSAGKPLKKFQVTDVMKVGKEYTLKTMRVETVSPGTGKSTGVTYLELAKPKKVEPSRPTR